MQKIARRAVLLGALLLAACVQVPPPNAFGALEPTLPPPAPGAVRLYFYRLLEPYELPTGTIVYLNGQAVGYSRNGTVIYRDVAPGTYEVSVLSRGAYPYQFKTITVQPGQVWFMRIESLLSLTCGGLPGAACPDAIFVVNIVDPAQARTEIAPLALVGG